ncbi:aminodeoxychorismate synthase, glutamine amidotransferase subunit [Shewanella denitrificans OS217]|jgi:anthranilate synthase component II|uniref:Aminodeoxychorismate synthase, glutamine amidotransferase subunit n=1 Tax=Shewanella denitrificans (strain OS217 / ATCC BAA-1090 / DSM 15013) TaxID=318161 RepID=Q12RL1_SHEDO|nr:aminodeoxychorismate/anthranilate synthase component II [Shewanella denitrificans]ABE53915.1 aminodeoxychorismate synthase, glutamine amidotransferase subunit [Shewanella denitrificans OS217]
MKVLLVDAFDSFVFVIEHYYAKCGAKTKVVRVNDNPLEHYQQWQPDLLVLGPGPGTHEEHGYLDILNAIDEDQAVFGVCLGHQAIGAFFGWKLMRAPTVEHGKYAMIQHDGQGIFNRVPSPIKVVRYHSLAIAAPELDGELLTTAITQGSGVNMAIRHRTRPIEAVQFHPESIGTEHGLAMVRNSLALVNRVSIMEQSLAPEKSTA